MSKESYERIAVELKEDPRGILFLSDNVKEIMAAQEAGMSALIVDRPGNADLTSRDKKVSDVVTNFSELLKR